MLPLEQSLKHHELRPYQINASYRAARHGFDMNVSQGSMTPQSHKSGQVAAQTAKILSASPFRAVIEVGNPLNCSQNMVDDDEDDDLN